MTDSLIVFRQRDYLSSFNFFSVVRRDIVIVAINNLLEDATTFYFASDGMSSAPSIGNVSSTLAERMARSTALP